MRVRDRNFVWVAMLAVIALTFAACAQGPEAEVARADAEKSAPSGGMLSRLIKSSTPVTLPAGTPLVVTLDQSLASDQHRAGDSFEASLAAPVVINGKTVIPKGAPVVGRVVDARESGRLKGVAQLRLALTSVEAGGKTYDLQTTTLTRSGSGHKKRNTILIGGGTGTGALIGGLAGGGKGALIGGAIGAGAGTATAAATGKKEITLPAESQLSFKLTQGVTIETRN